MTYSECYREHKIDRQSKPFVNNNLQLQLPGCDIQTPLGDTSFSRPIYSHYASSCPSPSYLPSQINEKELHQIMAEAESSYEEWKKMQQCLKDKAEAHYSKYFNDSEV